VAVPPETRYARSGDVNVAYQVTGEGPVGIVYVDVISHLELVWEVPSHAAFLDRLASIGRLITLNQRGIGMSDRVAGPPTLEMRMDDIRARDGRGRVPASSRLWSRGRWSALRALRCHLSGADFGTRADELFAPLRSERSVSLASNSGGG